MTVRSIRLNASSRNTLLNEIAKAVVNYQAVAEIEKQIAVERQRLGLLLSDSLEGFKHLTLKPKRTEYPNFVTVTDASDLGVENKVSVNVVGLEINRVGERFTDTFPYIMEKEELELIRSLCSELAKQKASNTAHEKEIRQVIDGCSSTLQLIEAYPEWEQYFPAFLKPAIVK